MLHTPRRYWVTQRVFMTVHITPTVFIKVLCYSNLISPLLKVTHLFYMYDIYVAECFIFYQLMSYMWHLVMSLNRAPCSVVLHWHVSHPAVYFHFVDSLNMLHPTKPTWSMGYVT